MTTTAKKSSQQESGTESCPMRQSSAISEHSSIKGTPTAIREWLMSCPRDSLASRSASLESKQEAMTAEICGRKPSMYFAEYDRGTRSWRTSQACLLTNTPDEFTETWPKAGLMLSGVAYPQPKQEPRIAVIDGGLLPTPTDVSKGGGSSRSGERINETPTLQGMARKGIWPTPHGFSKDGKSNGPSGNELGRAVNRFATPTVQDAANNGGPSQYDRNSLPLNAQVGGSLNPTWVEWLMGWPLGWTDLEPLEMDKFQQWLEQHGIS